MITFIWTITSLSLLGGLAGLFTDKKNSERVGSVVSILAAIWGIILLTKYYTA